MANLETPYEHTRQIAKLAEQAGQENFEFDRDLGEQAERMEEIAERAAEAAEIFRALEEALDAREA